MPTIMPASCNSLRSSLHHWKESTLLAPDSKPTHLAVSTKRKLIPVLAATMKGPTSKIINKDQSLRLQLMNRYCRYTTFSLGLRPHLLGLKAREPSQPSRNVHMFGMPTMIQDHQFPQVSSCHDGDSHTCSKSRTGGNDTTGGSTYIVGTSSTTAKGICSEGVMPFTFRIGTPSSAGRVQYHTS